VGPHPARLIFTGPDSYIRPRRRRTSSRQIRLGTVSQPPGSADKVTPRGGARAPARRRVFADIRPLQESPEYRRLWVGQSLSSIGNQITTVAVPFQVYSLTRSSLAVGLIGLAVAVPLITFGLLGSSFADAIDRRRLVLLTSGLLAVVSAVFAAQALLDLRQLWLLYVLIAFQSCLFAVDIPARRTFLPRLLPAGRLPAATALSQLSFQTAVVAGPLIAGVVIAAWGLQTAYLLDAATFIGAVYAVLRLSPMPAQGQPARPGLRAVAEGLRFVRRQPILATTILVDIDATVLGMPYALFPAFALTQFGGGAHVVGLLYAAPAMGGVLGATFSGRLSHVRRQGLALLVAVAVWGAAIVAFGLSSTLWLAVVLLAVAGAADMTNAVFRNTILQVNTPDELRGRVNGVAYVVGAGGPRLGDIEAGVVASLTSPAFSAISGGLGCLAGVVVLGLTRPALSQYEAKVQVRAYR
jgi:MFS family permease